MFKVKNNVAPEVMKELFAPKVSPYDLRHKSSKRRVSFAWHDTESVSYMQSVSYFETFPCFTKFSFHR